MFYFILLSILIFLICFVEKAEYAHKEHYIPMSLMLTVFSMCREEAITLFLERAIM